MVASSCNAKTLETVELEQPCFHDSHCNTTQVYNPINKFCDRPFLIHLYTKIKSQQVYDSTLRSCLSKTGQICTLQRSRTDYR